MAMKKAFDHFMEHAQAIQEDDGTWTVFVATNIKNVEIYPCEGRTGVDAKTDCYNFLQHIRDEIILSRDN